MKKQETEKINRLRFKKEEAKRNFDWLLLIFIAFVIIMLVAVFAK